MANTISLSLVNNAVLTPPLTISNSLDFPPLQQRFLAQAATDAVASNSGRNSEKALAASGENQEKKFGEVASFGSTLLVDSLLQATKLDNATTSSRYPKIRFVDNPEICPKREICAY